MVGEVIADSEREAMSRSRPQTENPIPPRENSQNRAKERSSERQTGKTGLQVPILQRLALDESGRVRK